MDGLFRILERYPDCDPGSSRFSRCELQATATHHFQALLYIFQGDAWPDFIRGIKAGAVVLYNDLCAGIGVPCPDGNAQRVGIGISAVLDCVFNDRLQCKRRNAKAGKGRVPIHDEHIVQLRLFHGQVSAGVLQFCRKGNGAVTGDSVEIFAQIVSEIHRDLPGLLRIGPAKAVDGHQGIITRCHHESKQEGTREGLRFWQLPLKERGKDG